ncbi:hypothetical protein F5Y19DRAFT_454336 [Xylariaceae sp. FL1651]|nr:hypothetical protein F5Y19DRAFT_454336 [Xylariaceae sp. FL1651]
MCPRASVAGQGLIRSQMAILALAAYCMRHQTGTMPLLLRVCFKQYSGSQPADHQFPTCGRSNVASVAHRVALGGPRSILNRLENPW